MRLEAKIKNLNNDCFLDFYSLDNYVVISSYGFIFPNSIKEPCTYSNVSYAADLLHCQDGVVHNIRWYRIELVGDSILPEETWTGVVQSMWQEVLIAIWYFQAGGASTIQVLFAMGWKVYRAARRRLECKMELLYVFIIPRLVYNTLRIVGNCDTIIIYVFTLYLYFTYTL